jgi:hypothetical protein
MLMDVEVKRQRGMGEEMPVEDSDAAASFAM